MKKLSVCLFLFFICSACSYALQYDDSLDADIRKKYNAGALPPLPKSAPSKTALPAAKIPDEISKFNPSGKTYTLKNNTKLMLISKEKVTNWHREGAKISFLLQNPVMLLEGGSIPAGTVVKGTVIDSHAPQAAGNGGLVKLKINEIYYNGIMSVIDADLTSANEKRVMKNDIKGKRKYLQNCSKAMTPGRKTYKTMKKAASALAPIPVINILSAVPYIIGASAYIINLPAAPIASIFMKGGAVSIPKGAVFRAEISGNNKIRG